MSRLYTLSLTFIATLTLLFSLSLHSTAATFSGRVIDEVGKPVAGIEVALPGFSVTTPQEQDDPMFLPFQQAKTNERGEFRIDAIISPSVQLTLLPYRDAAYEIRSAKIEGVSFYIQEMGFHSGLTFAIATGTDIKDVEITVRQRMRIRGRVLSADGTPLRNERVMIKAERRKIDGRGRGSSSSTTDLDADGYFVEYVRRPAYYTISVEYQGLSATSEEILLEDGERHDNLVLTLDGKPTSKPDQPDRAVALVDHRARIAAIEAASNRRRQGMWAINPKNRHAYKRIHCDNREEAQARAVEQEAHLVAINDAEEQEWLLEVFGKENFWIGLTDATEAENPHWDNGEPVTYTNWSPAKKATGSEGTRAADEPNPNYVVLIGLTGKWQETRLGEPLAGFTQQAILEKKHFTLATPE